MSGSIYMIPNSLGNSDPNTYLPQYYHEIICGLKFYVVENIRNARRFLKSIDKDVNIDELTFFELNKHTKESEISSYLQPVMEGNNLGVISEAGLPGIADPGAALVKIAQRKKIKVHPITGPSSIFLALMASGLNGQQFRFVGYLPVNGQDRIQAIRTIETKAHREKETQIFIETPYRNMAMLEDILKTCKGNTMLTVGVDITLDSESIITASVDTWKKRKVELHKRPAVFLLGT